MQNTIDTSWLDGLIKEKSVSVTQPPHLVVTSAAIYKAFQHINEVSAELKGSLAKGQTSLSEISNMNSFPIEIAYLDTKYPFTVSRLAPNLMNLEVREARSEATSWKGAFTGSRRSSPIIPYVASLPPVLF